MVLAAYSGRNVDRLVTLFRAAKRSRSTLVLDLYAAAIARATGRDTSPQAEWACVFSSRSASASRSSRRASSSASRDCAGAAVPRRPRQSRRRAGHDVPRLDGAGARPGRLPRWRTRCGRCGPARRCPSVASGASRGSPQTTNPRCLRGFLGMPEEGLEPTTRGICSRQGRSGQGQPDPDFGVPAQVWLDVRARRRQVARSRPRRPTDGFLTLDVSLPSKGRCPAPENDQKARIR